MKRILMLLILIVVCVESKGQNLDSLQIIEKAKDYFKKVYVESNFKDPYSYELLKITANKVSLKDKINMEISTNENVKKYHLSDSSSQYSEISVLKERINYLSKELKKGEKLKIKDINKYNEKYSSTLKSVKTYERELEDLRFKYIKIDETILSLKKILDDDSIKMNVTAQWAINLHCYAANSYGNKILGKYIFRMSTEGRIEGDVIKTN